MKHTSLFMSLFATVFLLMGSAWADNPKGDKPEVDKPQVEKPTEQQKPTEQPAEKPTEQEVEKPTEQQAEKPTEQQTEKPTEQQAEKPVEQGKPVETPVQQDTPVQQETESVKENLDAKMLAKLRFVSWVNFRLARMALKAEGKDVSEAIKEFAQELRKESKSSLKSLRRIARRSHIALCRFRAETEAEKNAVRQMRSLARELRSLQGKDRQMKFLAAVVSSHELALSWINDGRSGVENADLVSLIDDLRSKLEASKEKAAQLQSEN